jgi:hypothetical protein
MDRSGDEQEAKSATITESKHQTSLSKLAEKSLIAHQLRSDFPDQP